MTDLTARLLLLAEKAVDEAMQFEYGDPDDRYIYRELQELRQLVQQRAEKPTPEDLPILTGKWRAESATMPPDGAFHLNLIRDDQETPTTQPELEGPISESELAAMWNQQADAFNQWESLDSGEQLAWAQARAVSRYARPAVEPVPVSERMPGPEDCDSEGKCWWFSGWVTKFWNYHKPRDRAISQTHWLPYHALPLPAK